MSGIRNAFSVIPLSTKTSAVNLMQPLDKMGMAEMTKTQREAINTALGVPQSLVLSNAANFATATQDVYNFYDTTVVPLTQILEEQLNERLYIPRGYRLQFRPERLEVYQQIEYTKAEKLNGMLDRNVISIAEYRAAIGYSAKPIEE
jgi:phage portal protein BeeE